MSASVPRSRGSSKTRSIESARGETREGHRIEKKKVQRRRSRLSEMISSLREFTFLRRFFLELDLLLALSSLSAGGSSSAAGPVPMDGGPSSSGREHRGTRRTSRGGDDDREQRQSSDRPSSAALDFLSPAFDAALALSTPGLLPPDPRAPVLDNVTACRRLLPPGAEGAFPGGAGGGAAAAAAAEKKASSSRPLTTAAAAVARQSRPRRVPALDAIAESSAGGGSDGPLALLKRAYDAKSRVRVVTRHARGVRGSAVGTLAGFDVFFNLILKDVVEEYTVRVPVTRERPPRKKKEGEEEEEEEKEEGLAPRQRRLRHGYRLESRTRSLRLVFLRGDSVGLVSSISCG